MHRQALGAVKEAALKTWGINLAKPVAYLVGEGAITFPPRLLTALRLLLSTDHELAALEAWTKPPLAASSTIDAKVGDIGPLANVETEFRVLSTLANLIAAQAAKLGAGLDIDAAALAGGEGACAGAGVGLTVSGTFCKTQHRRRMLCAIYRSGQRRVVANALAAAERLRDVFHCKHAGVGLALPHGFDWSGESIGTHLEGWSPRNTALATVAATAAAAAAAIGGAAAARSTPEEGGSSDGGGVACAPSSDTVTVTDELPGERLVAASTALATPVLGEALAQVQGLDEETMLRLLLVRHAHSKPAADNAAAAAAAAAAAEVAAEVAAKAEAEATLGTATVVRSSLLQWLPRDWSHFGATAAAAVPGSVGLAGELKAAVAEHQADLDDSYDSMFPALSDALPDAFDPAVYTMRSFVDASVGVWSRGVAVAAPQSVVVVTPTDAAPVPHASIPTTRAVLAPEGNGRLQLVDLVKPLQQSIISRIEGNVNGKHSKNRKVESYSGLNSGNDVDDNDDAADDDEDDDNAPELLPAALSVEAGIDNATLMARCGVCSEDNPNESLVLSIAYLRLLGAFPLQEPGADSAAENERHVLTRQGLPASFYAALVKSGIVQQPVANEGGGHAGAGAGASAGASAGSQQTAEEMSSTPRAVILAKVAVGALNKYHAALEAHLARMQTGKMKQTVLEQQGMLPVSRDADARYNLAATFVASKCALLEDAANTIDAALRK